MALKKSDLYSSLWAACDDLRGPMDPSQYKDYVLVLLFIKYISDKYAGEKYPAIAVPTGSSFADMVALKGSDDIGNQINTKIIAPLAKANNLSDMPDFADPSKLGSGKEMVERLTNLIALFQDPRLDFSKNRAEGDDILGDAYEYLMRHFATASGKSKGQFYTPAEVSRIMARLVGINSSATTNDTTVYDPTCGSGSLLLKVADEAAQASGAKVTLYGQENEATTAGLARMNIRQGNTITDPKFLNGQNLKTFDFVVANPPFSDKRWSTGLNADNDYGRFSHFGRPPAKQGDYAYLLHIIASLKSSGQGACILPHGVLFRGNAEAVIRRSLVQAGYIKAIVGLPTNLFFGTGIPACIVVIDKQNAAARKGIFMIDASKGFAKDGPKNRLREQDIHRIIDTFTRLADVPGYARMVPLSEIAAPENDYNLNLPRYIEPVDAEDIQDVSAHIKGGIPDRDLDLLADYWKVMPALRAELFAPSDRAGYSVMKVGATQLRNMITAHPEFLAYRDSVEDVFTFWRLTSEKMLTGIAQGDSPKHLIGALSESLLSVFTSVQLLDAYDLYQALMEYWAETMQDDAYMIAIDGWFDAAQPREVTQAKDKNGKNIWPEEHDFLVSKRRFKSDLVPANLMIDSLFASQRDALTALSFQLEEVDQELEAEREEHAVEGGLLEDVAEITDDKGKIAAADVKKWLKENSKDPELVDEVAIIKRYGDLLARQADLKSLIKANSENLDKALASMYPTLEVDEIKRLVVADKWLDHLEFLLLNAVDGVRRELVSRLQVLADRYQEALSAQVNDLKALSERVANHLEAMGVV
jgi:type I restriction enzyme M protein